MNTRLDIQQITKAAGFLRAVGHPLRLAIVSRLKGRKAKVGDLVRDSGSAQAEVSKQLAVLRRAGIVRAEPSGNERWYSIEDQRVFFILECISKHSQKTKENRS